MSDRALIRADMGGAILAANCCAAPHLAVGLPFAGLGLVAWGVHHRRAKVAGCETKIHMEGVKS